MVISIHALREEGDVYSPCRAGGAPYFYPRPPRGGRQLAKWSYFISPVFLSTPSVRRATVRCAILRGHRKHFYPRPPQGGRPAGAGHGSGQAGISIHALRKEGDAAALAVLESSKISIHALRKEGDPPARNHSAPRPRISIHALRKEGDIRFSLISSPPQISIHALRKEGDITKSGFVPKAGYFYPRPPQGGRHGTPPLYRVMPIFLSTPSARRATRAASARPRWT